MADRNDDRFRLRPRPPKARGSSNNSRFIAQVAGAMKRAGVAVHRGSTKPGARLGRGHAVMRLSDPRSGASSRRVAIKARLVKLATAAGNSTPRHLRYIERAGIGRDGEEGHAYGAVTDHADVAAFEARCEGNRHQFRFIVAPEDARELEDLHAFTRNLVTRMETDLGTSLDWVAVDHWDTEHPHTHLVVRGQDVSGQDLIIAGDYIARGMRARAEGIVTDRLGPRTPLEIQRSLQREVTQERWTSLDRALQRHAAEHVVDMTQVASQVSPQHRDLLQGRLKRLEGMQLAGRVGEHAWRLEPTHERILRQLGERDDIIRTLQRAFTSREHPLAVPELGERIAPVVGRIVAKGLHDELQDVGYLVVDGLDGRAHYVRLEAQADLAHYPVGGIVDARPRTERAVDETIQRVSHDGLYRREAHRASLLASEAVGDINETLLRHERRLEALRRAHVVERLGDGVWRVPEDLVARGLAVDRRMRGALAVTLLAEQSLAVQTNALGATWLDRQLIAAGVETAPHGFGTEVREAMHARADVLVERGLAQRRGATLLLSRDLLRTLTERELTSVAGTIARETGLRHRPVVDGQSVRGVYRRSVALSSGRFALLDDGFSFSLVPWKPVIEQRLGQTLSAIVSRGQVSWQIGRGLDRG